MHKLTCTTLNSIQTEININNRKKGNEECAVDFPRTYVVVDTTELVIETNERKLFSGKKKNFTLKYQTVVGAVSGEILAIHGAEPGPKADSKIYVKSGFEEYLIEKNEFSLAD